MTTRTKIRALLILCAASLALAGPASAEPAGVTRNGAADALPPFEVLTVVRASGFDPLSRPVRSGRTYTLRALDSYDLEVNLVVDARSGRVLSASEAAAPRDAARRGPAYEPSGAPVYGRIFGPPDDEFGSPRPPRSVPGVANAPSVSSVPDIKPPQEKAAARLSAARLSAAPLPRPRPYVMEATGSVPAAADTPAVQKNPAPATDDGPLHNGGASMPPVAPLD